MIDLVVYPARQPGKFWAVWNDRQIVNSRQPFLASARVLLAQGIAPDTPLLMRHAGSEMVALRSTVGAAANWTVKDPDRGSPSFATYNASPFSPAPRNSVDFDLQAAE